MMEEPTRPIPPRPPIGRARDWIEWFGVGRLVGSAAAMVIVCAGAFWLLRTPPPPTEALLPMTATTVSDSLPPAERIDTDAPSAPVAVHVAGAVVRAGVYELAADARVEVAIAAAGGLLADADANAINLAAFVVDGSRIYVPRIGEVVSSTLTDNEAGVPAGPIDVNRATAEQLDALPGIGPATAGAIVTERERNGPFISVDELERVPGIGPAKLDAIRSLVTT